MKPEDDGRGASAAGGSRGAGDRLGDAMATPDDCACGASSGGSWLKTLGFLLVMSAALGVGAYSLTSASATGADESSPPQQAMEAAAAATPAACEGSIAEPCSRCSRGCAKADDPRRTSEQAPACECGNRAAAAGQVPACVEATGRACCGE
jgi:hypothetical protein